VDVQSTADAKTAFSWMPNSSLEQALRRVKDAQTLVDEAQSQLKRAKQVLDATMRGSLR